MAQDSTPLFIGKMTFGVGETASSGQFGEQVSVTYNRLTGEAQLNAQVSYSYFTGKYSITEAGTQTFGVGLGNVVGTLGSVKGTSDFLGFIYNTQYGFGVQAG